MTFEQNGGQNHNINISNKYFENIVKFRYLGTTITNKNYFHEKSKSKVNSGND
jgi:hypothetical protein